MRRLLVTIMIITAFTSIAKAQEPLALSLKDCTDYALKHNYAIKNSQIDVLIQHAQNNETLAAAYPHINGRAEFDQYVDPTKSFFDGHLLDPAVPAGTILAFPFSLTYAGAAAVSGSQLLFDGSVFVAWKARNTVMEFARNNQQVSEETVRYNVYKAYNALVIAYRQYDILKNSLVYARSLEHDLEVTRENGLAEKIEVERTSVQVNNLTTDSIRIGNLLTTSEQMLKYQMGMDINKPIILTDTAVEERKQYVLALLDEQEQYDRVPEYIALKTALKLNNYNLLRYKLAAIPTLNLFGAAGYNYGDFELGHMFFWPNYAFNSMWAVQLNVPIFNGALRTNQVREAKLNIEKSQNNIENMKQIIDFQAATSRTSLKNAVLEVQSQRRNLDLAKDVLDLAQRKYKAGVGSNIEVTQAQADQLTAQNNYFSALLDLINAEADLKKALGLLK